MKRFWLWILNRWDARGEIRVGNLKVRRPK